MKQITQKELIDLIKEKQENAKNMFYITKQSEKDFGEAQLKKARCLAEMDTYQDLICYLNSVEIVPERNDELDARQYAMKGLTYMPEEQIKTTIPKDKQEELGLTKEDFKAFIPPAEPVGKIDLNKIPITPYNEPKVEPLRNDRFIEFEKKMSNCVTYKDMVDAKSIMFIRFVKNNKEYSVEFWCSFGYITQKTFIEEARAIAYYNDLVEWWKYWKQN